MSLLAALFIFGGYVLGWFLGRRDLLREQRRAMDRIYAEVMAKLNEEMAKLNEEEGGL